MKINSKQYALALYEIAKDKKKNEIELMIKNLVNVLIANNDISKVDEIMNEFDKVWNYKEGVVDTTVLSAKKLDEKTLELLNKYLLGKLEIKKVDIITDIDEKLLGGVILKYGDKILDGSIKTKLNNFKSRLKN
ncbi:ATP synthase F1 subunit delta [Candidatus Parcubacteria bacterium]|nr:ATP synthase F1 subunit delta [Candidatus Parcubacteria bacterium]